MTLNVDPVQDAYEHWLAELQRLAKAQDVEWLIAPASHTHRAGFEKGSTPEEELAALKDLAEWRGCGCGGGG
ncbi:MAG: hypothetical protein ABW110_11755 [Steroidobacteraceae bacterium]